jgi:hypothetical protein
MLVNLLILIEGDVNALSMKGHDVIRLSYSPSSDLAIDGTSNR